MAVDLFQFAEVLSKRLRGLGDWIGLMARRILLVVCSQGTVCEELAQTPEVVC